MVWRIAFNPGDSPVPTSHRGHTLGGREWGPVDTAEACVDEGVTNGALLLVAGLPDDRALDPAAVAAYERASRYADRSEAMSSLTTPQLLAIARSAGVVDAGETQERDELEYRLLDSLAPLEVQRAGKKKDPEKDDGGDQGAAGGEE